VPPTEDGTRTQPASYETNVSSSWGWNAPAGGSLGEQPTAPSNTTTLTHEDGIGRQFARETTFPARALWFAKIPSADFVRKFAPIEARCFAIGGLKRRRCSRVEDWTLGGS
jgi:hypothetical protein